MKNVIDSLLKITPDSIASGEAVVGYTKDGKQIAFPYKTDACSDLNGFFSSRELGLVPVVARTREELNASGATEAWFADGYSNPLNPALGNPEYVEPNLTLERARIVDGATTIGDRAFEACLHLREIVIPETVTTIGNDAFGDCENLQCINLPEGLRSIPKGLFAGCINLRNLVIPEGVETIGPWIIDGCLNLKFISIPSTVKEIDFRFDVSTFNAPKFVTVYVNQTQNRELIHESFLNDTWTVFWKSESVA